jgi:hypothetical protein
MTIEKIRVKKEFFHKQKNSPIVWEDIKHIQFQDDDEIQIGYDEGHYSENNSWDPHYFAIVERWRDETDEEAKKRIEDKVRDQKWAKERRYQSYLKLKEEFETKNNQQ